MTHFTFKMKIIVSTVLSFFIIITMTFGQALNFDGVDDYATIPSTGTGILGDYSVPHNYTIETYFKFTGSTSKKKIFSRTGLTPSNFYIETTTDGKLKMGIGTNFTWIGETYNTAPLVVGTWYHAALSVDMNTLIMGAYIDGVEYTEINLAYLTSIGAPGGYSDFGYSYAHDSGINTTFAYSEDWGENADITIDYVRVWDHIRTPAQIAANFDTEVPCTESGLIANYLFNEGTAGADNSAITSLSDCTGNGYNATVSNMALSGTSSNFVVGNNLALLPVELTYFQAEKENKTSLLTWETASELNNKGFHIEHSTDGRNFEKIAWMDGYGNTTEIQEYEFIHERPNTGLNYYRLMQEDFDGTSSYSEIRTVAFDADLGIKVFPNPSKLKGNTNIQLASENAQQVNVSVFNLNGKQVSSMNYDINKGNNTLPLNHDSLSNGLYIISITHDGGTENVKLHIVK